MRRIFPRNNIYLPPGVTCDKCRGAWLKKGCERCATTGMCAIPEAEMIKGKRMGDRHLITLRPKR